MTLAAARATLRPLVLIADDEPGMRLGMQRVLTSRGFACELAANGEDALAMAKQRSFGLALVDLKMPGVDGFELISRLRELDPSTICIVVSAFATIQSAVRSTRMGAFDFIAKPFEPQELMTVVSRAAEQWALAREADALRAERESHLLELSAEKSRLRTILQAMGEGLMVVNKNGEVVLDNPATRRFLGMGSCVSRAPIAEVLPDPRFLAEVRSLLDADPDAPVVDLEICLPPRASAPKPTDRYLRATLAPIRAGRAGTIGAESTPIPQGDILGVVVVLADITDDKALERAKTLFVSMVAHEIKAPIAAVEGYLRLIRDGSYDDEPDRIPAVLDRCLERTGALLSLVQDLLELTRRDAGRRQRRLEAIDLPALVTELVQFHAPAAARRAIAIHVDVDAATPKALVDRNDVERIVTNLLSNAIKYNRDNGSVHVGLGATPGEVVLEVRDTGVGMSPAELARLGEEFFRAKDPRTRSITGTGLGVALVKKIVESYHGQLDVESLADAGSVFRVRLPAPTEPPDEPR